MWLPPLVWARQHRAAACTPYNRESNAVFPRHPPRLCPTSIRQRPTDLNHLKYTSHKHCNITPWKLLQNYVQQYDTKTYIDHWWRCYVSSSSTSSTQCVSTTTVDTGREPSYITLSLEFEPRCIAKQNQTCLSKASSQPLGKNLGLFPPRATSADHCNSRTPFLQPPPVTSRCRRPNKLVCTHHHDNNRNQVTQTPPLFDKSKRFFMPTQQKAWQPTLDFLGGEVTGIEKVELLHTR